MDFQMRASLCFPHSFSVVTGAIPTLKVLISYKDKKLSGFLLVFKSCILCEIFCNTWAYVEAVSMIKLTGTFAGHVGRIRQFASCCVAISLATLCIVVRAEDITHGYDALGRLTSVTVAGATAYYDYDAAGNITAIRRSGALFSPAPLSGADSSRATDGARPPSSVSARTSMR